MKRLIGALIVLAAGVALGACAGPGTVAADPLGAPPEDFTIDLTVLVEPQPGRPRPVEAHLRQSRIVLFPDGSLHFGTDDRRGANWLPGLTRRLSREQVAHVWALSRQLGLARADLGEPVRNFTLERARAGEVAYLVAFTGGDQRWAFIHRAPIEGDHDSGMVTLVRTLAQLAWATDLDESAQRLPPQRHDFGPDPYARYR